LFESCFQNITQNIATQQRIDTILDFCTWSNRYGKEDTNVPTSISISCNSNNTTTTATASTTTTTSSSTSITTTTTTMSNDVI
jgi:hypothetical protein